MCATIVLTHAKRNEQRKIDPQRNTKGNRWISRIYEYEGIYRNAETLSRNGFYHKIFVNVAIMVSEEENVTWWYSIVQWVFMRKKNQHVRARHVDDTKARKEQQKQRNICIDFKRNKYNIAFFYFLWFGFVFCFIIHYKSFLVLLLRVIRYFYCYTNSLFLLLDFHFSLFARYPPIPSRYVVFLFFLHLVLLWLLLLYMWN